MRSSFLLILVLACSFSGRLNATVIDAGSYASDAANPMYWSAFDLDIMRLSWSDTLGDHDSQASEGAVNQFVNTNIDGWRWATVEEFFQIHQFFDTDGAANGWSTAQNAGSSLFFFLNGTGPTLTAQQGYDFEGYTYWQFGTEVNSSMQYAWMADFATNIAGITCAEYSMLCNSGYFTDENSPMWMAPDALGMSGINVAPLLVRSGQVVPQPDAVAMPLPATVWLFGLGLIAIFRRRFYAA